MISPLPLLVLLAALAAVGAEPFTGVRVTLSKTHMQAIAQKGLQEAFNELRTKNLVMQPKTWSLGIINYNVTTVPKASLVLKDDYTHVTTDLSEGIFKISYTNLLELASEFTSSVTFTTINIGSGNGKATVDPAGTRAELTYKYNEIVPKPTVDGKYDVSSVDFEAGHFTEAMLSIIKSQFVEVINKIFDDLNKDVDDPLKKYEEPVQILDDGRSASINRKTVAPKHETAGESRFVNSTLVLTEGKELTLACDFERQVAEGSSEMCFCPYIFPAILVEASVEKNVELADWNLNGKVVELFEIIPDLINIYSPYDTYTVTQKEVAVSEKSDPSKPLLNKTYDFKIGAVSVMKVYTSFELTLAGEQENGEFFVKQSAAAIEDMYTDVLVQPSGKAVLARLMLYETQKIAGKRMFIKGIAIDTATSARTVRDGKESFCVEFSA